MIKLILLLMFSLISYRASANNCYIVSDKPVRYGFFNGVGTTLNDAHDDIVALNDLTGENATLFYNQTEGYQICAKCSILAVYGHRVVVKGADA